MNRVNFKILIVLLELLISWPLFAQNQFKRVAGNQSRYKYFQILGQIKTLHGDPASTSIEVIDLDQNVSLQKLSLNSSGKFSLNLNYAHEFRLKFAKDGFYDKELLVSTIIPPSVWERDSVFPPFVTVITLYKKVQGASPLSFEGKSVGKISYSPNGRLDNFDSETFIDDKQIQDEITITENTQVDLRFNKKIEEALDLERKADLANALLRYREALTIKPKEKFAQEKIDELLAELKDSKELLRKQAEFNRLVALGDDRYKGKKYQEAVSHYQDALAIFPDDQSTKEKILDAKNELDRLNALAFEETKFRSLVREGDDLVNQAKYSDGIEKYKNALVIRPGDNPVIEKLSKAELQLAEYTNRMKKEAEFQRILANGDEQVNLSHYVEGLSTFNLALQVIPEDPRALSRIDNVQKILALANKRASEEAAFKRLVAEGDNQALHNNYSESIAFYNQALQIIPNDSVVLRKIAEVEKRLASIGQRSHLYDLALHVADQNFQQKQWNEAILKYSEALSIKPGETYPTKRIEEIKSIQKQEVDRLANYMANFEKGIAEMKIKHYSEALSSFESAQRIDPVRSEAEEKIKEIKAILLAEQTSLNEKNRALAAQQQLESQFQEKIKLGDQNYGKSLWSNARFYYLEGLKLKPESKYAQNQIDLCDKMIDSNISEAQLEEYKKRVASGDEAFRKNNLSSSRFYYRQALDILNWELYPVQQLKMIDQRLTEQLSLADQKIFNEYLVKAEEAFNQREYPTSRFYYQKAFQLKETDQILSKLKAIEEAMNGQDLKKGEMVYQKLLQKGDEALSQQNKPLAKFYYLKAKALKPYDKELIGKLDKLEFEKGQ